jgi:hypothetical protein
MTDFVPWLRGLAELGGKGVVHNIDARSLGRVADEIERLTEERDRIERNRDMWREQCNRQADQIRGTRSLPSHQQGTENG